MIVNLPTVDALNATALKLYFRAWQGLIGILRDFDLTYPGAAEDWGSNEGDSWSDERAHYLELAQEDLHAILAITQQANEIALKARIVSVSPFLLLLNNDVGFNAISKSVEFSSLRTLDAVELPNAVNTLTDAPVSSAFIQRYGELRTIRNKYAHLGDTSIVLDPVDMCSRMVEQYRALWPDRPWFRDRLHSTHGREAFFDDKHWSPRQEILNLLDYDLELIPAAHFKAMFGTKKSEVKFGCHQCQDDWAVRRNGPFLSEAPTAFYDKAKKAMHCLICDEDFPATLAPCAIDGCGGKFRAPSTANYGAEKCFSCGE